ncbi:hypothetical protein ACH5RR_023169 [Cinchona calisaya]|uniref:Uncharacterized protein n=1 Tax=Cinchona calisaya TaxID=153742 RepID=A0ABD2Z9W8_9GENT
MAAAKKRWDAMLKMPRRMYQVLEVGNNTKGWTVLLQVIERSRVQISRPPN